MKNQNLQKIKEALKDEFYKMDERLIGKDEFDGNTAFLITHPGGVEGMIVHRGEDDVVELTFHYETPGYMAAYYYKTLIEAGVEHIEITDDSFFNLPKHEKTFFVHEDQHHFIKYKEIKASAELEEIKEYHERNKELINNIPDEAFFEC